MRKVTCLVVVVISVFFYGFATAASTSQAAAPVIVKNTASNPVPVSIQSANELFQKHLSYDQQQGTFPPFTAPAGKRVVIQNMSWIALVPTGKTPVGYGYVLTSTNDETFSSATIWTQISNFSQLQDRFAANLPTLFYIEPGGTFYWGVSDSQHEQPFSPLNFLNTSLTLTGYVVDVGP
jgi:hypothetical protein